MPADRSETVRCPACGGDTCIEPGCEDRPTCQRDFHERCGFCDDTGVVEASDPRLCKGGPRFADEENWCEPGGCKEAGEVADG